MFRTWGFMVKNGPYGPLYKIMKNALIIYITLYMYCTRNTSALGHLSLRVIHFAVICTNTHIFIHFYIHFCISNSSYNLTASRNRWKAPVHWPPYKQIFKSIVVALGLFSIYSGTGEWNLISAMQLQLMICNKNILFCYNKLFIFKIKLIIDIIDKLTFVNNKWICNENVNVMTMSMNL